MTKEMMTRERASNLSKEELISHIMKQNQILGAMWQHNYDLKAIVRMNGRLMRKTALKLNHMCNRVVSTYGAKKELTRMSTKRDFSWEG